MGDVSVDERIGSLVAARREQLAELVRRAVDLELERLVDVELEQRTNGNGAAHATVPAATVPASKVCSGPCGRLLPITAFEARRAKCRDCRRGDLARARDRRRAARQAEPASSVDAEPRPSIAVDELLRRVTGHGAVAPDLEPWLIAEQLAVRVPAGLAPTGRGIALGGAIELVSSLG